MHLITAIHTFTKNLRATLHMHGANFRHDPAHGLQRGVVVTDLHIAAHEVLLLKDDHATALVGLKGRERERDSLDFGFLVSCLIAAWTLRDEI